jgi:hypothetical protein
VLSAFFAVECRPSSACRKKYFCNSVNSVKTPPSFASLLFNFGKKIAGAGNLPSGVDDLKNLRLLAALRATGRVTTASGALGGVLTAGAVAGGGRAGFMAAGRATGGQHQAGGKHRSQH